MSDEPTPEDEVHEVEQETSVEAKSGKKAKADKKKSIAHTQPKEDQAVVKAAAETSGAIEMRQAATETPTAAAEDGAPVDRNDDLFQQGVQSMLRGEYDAADNLFGQALLIYRKQGDQAGQIDVFEQLGHLCYLRGAEAQAREYYQQAGLLRAV
jgi:TolA-binding protein